MRRMIAASLLPVLLAAGPPAASAAPIDPPRRAEKRPVLDRYWDEPIRDDYQYLENLADSSTARWVAEQSDYTRRWLDELPGRSEILRRVIALTHSESPDYYNLTRRGGILFAMKKHPPKEQPFLVVLPSLEDTAGERVLVDPNRIDAEGDTSIDFFEPSPDGSMVAVSLSRHGTEDGTLHVYETATGRKLPDEIPRVNGGTAGGSVAWLGDGSGFYYTRYPYPGERPAADLPFYQQVYRHRLSDPIARDGYEVGREFPRIAEIILETSPDGRWHLAEVANGDGGEMEYWLRGPDRAWKRFARFEDQVIEARFGQDAALYLLSRNGAPLKRVLRLPLADPDLARATVAAPESEGVIEGFTPTATRLYVVEMVGGPTRLLVYDLAGRALERISLGEIATVGTPARLGGDSIAVRSQSYTSPPAYYTWWPGSAEPRKTALAYRSAADFSDCEVRREFAIAADGTRLPVNLVLRRGTKLDGSAPVLLDGYGSYGISQKPTFSPSLRLWLEQGGVYAEASIRGGGEYGDAWHRAANLERKKLSMDDFADCARFLLARGYASRERLAVQGGSAGGLMVNGMMVHHPGLVRAVVAYVGIADALRTELSPNGEFNITEFGTVKNEREFRGMAAYSPYHHVSDRAVYPSYLALTGLNDPRVESWQSFKMVARLQATATQNPVLLRVSSDTGHGSGTSLSDRDREQADAFAFLFDQLGLRYRPIVAPRPSP